MYKFISKYKYEIIISIIACFSRLIHMIYVDRVWEDALITVLHSENLWNGLGLTHYHLGSGPVHGFTSPISVMVPIIGDVFKVGFGLYFIKIVSIFCGAATAILFYRILISKLISIPKNLAFIASLYPALEYQQVLWGMAGFETQIVVAIIFLSIICFLNYEKMGAVSLGICLALCMYARPDLIIWCLSLTIVAFFIDSKKAIKSALVGVVIYLPWTIFTIIYYGSPIPNTIRAKEAAFGGLPLPHTIIEIISTNRLYEIFGPLSASFSGYGTGALQFYNNLWIINLILIFSFIGVVKLLTKNILI